MSTIQDDLRRRAKRGIPATGKWKRWRPLRRVSRITRVAVSEYQYHEYAPIDWPRLRAISSRTRITDSSFVNCHPSKRAGLGAK